MIDPTTSTGALTYGTQSCSSRLPCGVCMLLGKPCPMFTNSLEPTWTTNKLNITCGDRIGSSLTCHSFEPDDERKEDTQ